MGTLTDSQIHDHMEALAEKPRPFASWWPSTIACPCAAGPMRFDDLEQIYVCGDCHMTQRQPDPLVELTVFVKWETPKAWLIEDQGKEVWIPKSQATLVTKSHSPRWIAELTLPEWLAKKGGLI